MIPVLLILVPLISGMLSFFIKDERSVRMWSMGSSMISLVILVLGIKVLATNSDLHAHYEWMISFGSSFTVGLDGMGKILTLLTAVSFPAIFLATWRHKYTKPNNFPCADVIVAGRTDGRFRGL